MKNLKIESNKGLFLRGTEWVDVVNITKEDLLALVKSALDDEDFEVDPYDEGMLPNPAQKIVYKHVSQQLQDIHDRREEFIERRRSIYKESYDKYCQE